MPWNPQGSNTKLGKKDIHLKDLVCIQLGVRDIPSLHPMVQHLKEGKDFSEDHLKSYATKHKITKYPRLIQLIHFGDGITYLNDGHHRVLSMLLAGRDVLKAEEYFVFETTYDFASRPQFISGVLHTL